MENLKKSFSNKFLEKVLELGEILPDYDDQFFYLLFKPNNDRAAAVHFEEKDLISVTELAVESYKPLEINCTYDGLEEEGNEGNAIWTLKLLHDK